MMAYCTAEILCRLLGAAPIMLDENVFIKFFHIISLGLSLIIVIKETSKQSGRKNENERGEKRNLKRWDK